MEFRFIKVILRVQNRKYKFLYKVIKELELFKDIVI